MTQQKEAQAKFITEPFVFFRGAHFYVVEIPRSQVVENVELNPGTTRVEDIKGYVIWQLQ